MAVGAGLFVALQRRQASVVAASRLLSAPVAAGIMAAQLAEVVHDYRVIARRRGVERLDAEFDSMGVSVPGRGADDAVSAGGVAMLFRGAAVDVEDRTLARRAVRGTIEKWLERAQPAEAGVSRLPTYRAAAKASAPRLELVASTESSSAFSGARLQEAQRIGIAGHVEMMRVWDATLDKRTCPTCSDLDGAMVPLRGAYPGGGSPGRVHPGCRCVESFVPVEFTQP